MREEETRSGQPEWKAMAAEASQALARLDADRLEELALCCAALNREPPPASAAEREERVRRVRAAAADLAVLARVLEATRANLQVMQRLRQIRMGQLEYSERQVRGGAAAENRHGDD